MSVQRADTRAVAYYAGVDIADAVLVEVGEGQCLQMREGVVSEVAVYPDLKAGGVGAGDVVCRGGEKDRAEVDRDEPRQSIERSAADEVIYRIALQDRLRNIDNAAEQTAEQHGVDPLFVPCEVGDYLADAEKGEAGSFCFFHFAASSAPAVWIS